MAYLDTSELAIGGCTAASVSARRAFDALEWRVIGLARSDRLRSLRAPGRLSRLLAAIVGGRPDPRLADPRLEALRRLAVLAWHQGYALPATAVAAARRAGFSVEQVELALASIARARPVRERKLAA